MDQAALLAGFLNYLQHQRLFMDQICVSAFALLIYDYALTLHLEIKYIWISRWNYTKVLFLLTRYLTIVIIFILLYNQTFLHDSAGTCRTTWSFIAWLMIIKNALAESILCIRTWAIWDRHKSVGILLVIAMLAYVAVQFSFETKVIHSLQIATPLYSGFRGCFLTGATRMLWVQFASLFVIELVVLTLMLISAFRLYRTGRTSELSFVIHRDGIMFYVYLLFLSGVNLIIIIKAPLDIIDLMIPMEVVLHTVFTTRIVLNIRSTANRGQDTELHTNYLDENLQPLPFPVCAA